MAEPYDALVCRLRAAGCVFAEEEAALLLEAADGRGRDALGALVGRRVAGEPLEQVLGWASFGGLRVAVEPGVFVPRQRTVHLAALACEMVSPGEVVVDVCCGSGALGLLVATRRPGIELWAVDVDPIAVACARRNLASVGGEVRCGDLLAPMPTAVRGRVAVLLANVPYVPSGAVGLMPPESRDHEPRHTVDGGVDGLDVLRRLAADAPDWMAPGGRLLTECSAAQAPVAVAVLEAVGLRARPDRSEEHDATVVIATKGG